jgi:XRE family aerobic/anaerobic benzoate catabolism transcriptional regulator
MRGKRHGLACGNGQKMAAPALTMMQYTAQVMANHRKQGAPALRSVPGGRGAAASPEPDAAFLAAVGRAVRERREQRGMARRALARKADVSERYLAQLETGEGNASIVLLRRVATALGARIVDLLDAANGDAGRQAIVRLVDSLPKQRLEQVLQSLAAEFGRDPAVRRKRIALIGLRGAGKSTLGQALARHMHRPFVELDREIEAEAGISLSELFLLSGQAGYRRIERRCLERVIAGQRDIVLTVGGGIVSEPETFRLLLANCCTIWIKAAPEEHMARVLAQGDTRPMAGHKEAMADLRRILAARESLYGQADIELDTSGQSVAQSLAALRRLVRPMTGASAS